MTTSPATTGTPLTRDQDDIVDRLRERLEAKRTDDTERRDIALIQVLDRDHAAQLMDRDTQGDAAVDELLAGYPDEAPTRETLFRLLTNGQPSQLLVNLPLLLKRARDVRSDLSLLAEYGWLLGRDGIAETVQGHADNVRRDLLAGIVEFCRAYGIPLPMEGADGGMAPDLAEAVAAVEAAA